MYLSILRCYFIIFIVLSLDKTVNSDCFNSHDYFWKHLATKTPYRYVANNNNSQIVFDGCNPHKIWAVLRHGTRYPGEKFINKVNVDLVEIQQLIIKNFDDNNSKLCPDSINKIKEWSPQMNISNSKKLAHEGEDEMIELAERFQERFPSLLQNEYSNSTFKVC